MTTPVSEDPNKPTSSGSFKYESLPNEELSKDSPKKKGLFRGLGKRVRRFFRKKSMPLVDDSEGLDVTEGQDDTEEQDVTEGQDDTGPPVQKPPIADTSKYHYFPKDPFLFQEDVCEAVMDRVNPSTPDLPEALRRYHEQRTEDSFVTDQDATENEDNFDSEIEDSLEEVDEDDLEVDEGNVAREVRERLNFGEDRNSPEELEMMYHDMVSISDSEGDEVEIYKDFEYDYEECVATESLVEAPEENPALYRVTVNASVNIEFGVNVNSRSPEIEAVTTRISFEPSCSANGKSESP